ncbi:MAG: SPOR domain-containing protein, partial [Candidatus Cloacimonetes bacterium]|nr:SPOR domain-containing protein [Candidatus Cloacimonadota bacterium]
RLFTLHTSSNQHTQNQQTPTSPPSTPQTPPPTQVTLTNTTTNPTRYEDLLYGQFYIQFGAFEKVKQAEDLINTLKSEKIEVYYITKPVNNKTWYAVIQGPFDSQTAAKDQQEKFPNRKNQSFIFEAK